MDSSTEKLIIKDLKINAKALGIPEGAADLFIKKTVEDVKKTLSKKQIITEKDLDLALAKELKKYNSDFAYVYRNRDKII